MPWLKTKHRLRFRVKAFVHVKKNRMHRNLLKRTGAYTYILLAPTDLYTLVHTFNTRGGAIHTYRKRVKVREPIENSLKDFLVEALPHA